MTGRVAAVFAAAGLGLLPGVAFAQGGGTQPAPAERLREIEEAAAKGAAAVLALEQRRVAVLDTLDRLDRSRRAAEAEVVRSRKLVAESQAELSKARSREKAVEDERWRVTKEMAPRLTLRYRLRGASYLRVLVEASSVGEFLWRRRVLDRLLSADLESLDRLERIRRDTELARNEVEEKRRTLAAAESAASLRVAEARKQSTELQSVLADIERQKETKRAVLEELERARDTLMEALGTQVPGSGLGGMGARKGKLPFPTVGRVEVRFGKQLVDSRFKTVLQQKGIDIRAPAGTPVWAVHAAQVAYAGWFKGFGNLVVLDHGESYFTLYAHLDEMPLKKGDRVREGQQVGTVGDTGSLKGAYLYFEIRSGQKALNPAQWLRRK